MWLFCIRFSISLLIFKEGRVQTRLQFIIFPSPLKRDILHTNLCGVCLQHHLQVSLFVLTFGLFPNFVVSRYQNNESLRHWLVSEPWPLLLLQGLCGPAFLLILDLSTQNLFLCSVSISGSETLTL